MSDLENVLRRLARLLQPDEPADGAQVVEDAEPTPPPEADRPVDTGVSPSTRDLPHRGAATP